jgi:hypothetical protein
MCSVGHLERGFLLTVSASFGIALVLFGIPLVFFVFLIYICLYVCADIFPSTCVEDQPIRSLTGTFQAMHASVGEAIFACETASELAQSSIFFFTHTYVVPKKAGFFGKLEEIPTPPLFGNEWPKPDVFSVMALRSKMTFDIKGALKFSKASRSVGLSWFCPMHIFAHIFKGLTVIHARTMYICREVGEDEMNGMLGNRWDIVEGVHQNDVFRCNVVPSTVTFRFLKARSVLYIRFHYQRWMKKRGEWIPLQASEEEIIPIHLDIAMPDGSTEEVTANKHWSLANLREHFKIMGIENVDESSFRFGKRKVTVKISNVCATTVFYAFSFFWCM